MVFGGKAQTPGNCLLIRQMRWPGVSAQPAIRKAVVPEKRAPEACFPRRNSFYCLSLDSAGAHVYARTGCAAEVRRRKLFLLARDGGKLHTKSRGVPRTAGAAVGHSFQTQESRSLEAGPVTQGKHALFRHPCERPVCVSNVSEKRKGHAACQRMSFEYKQLRKSGELGFEPRQADPESAVLPLHHSPLGLD